MSIEDLMNDEKCNYVGYDSFDKTDKNTKAIEELRQNVNTLNNEVDALSLNITTGDLQADMISATSVETATLLATSVETDALNAKEINLVRDLFIEGTNQDVGIVSIPENESVKVYMVSDSQSLMFSYSNGSFNMQASTGNIEKIDVYRNAGRIYFATYINNTDKVYYWTELAEDVQPITDLAYLGYTLEYSVVIENNGTYFAGDIFGYKNSFSELEANVLTNSEYIYGKDYIDLPETLDPDTEANNVYVKIPPFVGQVKLYGKNLANDDLFSITFNKEIEDADGDIAANLSYTTKNLDYIKDVFSDKDGNLYFATRAFGTLWFSTNTFEEMDVITADQGVAPYIPEEERLISYEPTLPARFVILGDGTLAYGLDIQGELNAAIIKLPEGVSYENLAVSGLLNAGNIIVENEIQVPPPVGDNNATTKLYVDTADEALQTEIDGLDTRLTSDINTLNTKVETLEAEVQLAQYTDPIQWGYTVTTSSTIDAIVANMPNNSKLTYSTTTVIRGPYMDGLPTDFGILEITKLSEFRYTLYWYESNIETKQVYYSQYRSGDGFSGWDLLYPIEIPDPHPDGFVYTKYKTDGKWAASPYTLWGGQWGVLFMTDTEVVYEKGKLSAITINSNLGSQTFDSLTATKSYISANKSSLTSITMTGGANIDDTSMNSMFYDCNYLTSLDLSRFDTTYVTNMSSMFRGCTRLTSLDLSSFDTTYVTNMFGIFYDCTTLANLNLSSFNTANVINMGSMFYGCRALTSLDLSSFNTSNSTNMNSMFRSCSDLKSLDLSSFNTAKVTNMNNMFKSCSDLTSVNLSSFNTANVTNTGEMFSLCFTLKSLDLSSFDTTKITSMDEMFISCIAVTSSYGRTQTDCNKLNSSSDKPANINFIVK